MGFDVRSETHAYAWLLALHLRRFAERLKALPEDRWDWTPDPAAPTARTLAAHTWQWLVCDRQHIENPDVLRHGLIPEMPAEPAAIVAAFEEEAENWIRLVESMSPESLDAPIRQFGGNNLGTARGFICHMVQNAIYKHGQFSTLFFALGLDGTEPYDAPWPNPIYERVWAAKADAPPASE